MHAVLTCMRYKGRSTCLISENRKQKYTHLHVYSYRLTSLAQSSLCPLHHEAPLSSRGRGNTLSPTSRGGNTLSPTSRGGGNTLSPTSRGGNTLSPTSRGGGGVTHYHPLAGGGVKHYHPLGRGTTE